MNRKFQTNTAVIQESYIPPKKVREKRRADDITSFTITLKDDNGKVIWAG